MSLSEKDVLRRVSGVTSIRLQTWVQRGWIIPAASSKGASFSEVDVARCDLIRQLRDDLGVENESVEIVLSLLDQVYGLRRELRAVMRAVESQPDDIRAGILEALSGEGERKFPK
ncbi:MAG: chaperone modulator CbpM [Hyphomicrobiaceae bacterium]|nr:chaperone modulator CbpM [Hyphomicrobiaceae bacterium]